MHTYLLIRFQLLDDLERPLDYYWWHVELLGQEQSVIGNIVNDVVASRELVGVHNVPTAASICVLF